MVTELGTDQLESFTLHGLVVTSSHDVDITLPAQVKDTSVDTSDPPKSKEQYVLCCCCHFVDLDAG